MNAFYLEQLSNTTYTDSSPDKYAPSAMLHS